MIRKDDRILDLHVVVGTAVPEVLPGRLWRRTVLLPSSLAHHREFWWWWVLAVTKNRQIYW